MLKLNDTVLAGLPKEVQDKYYADIKKHNIIKVVMIVFFVIAVFVMFIKFAESTRTNTTPQRPTHIAYAQYYVSQTLKFPSTAVYDKIKTYKTSDGYRVCGLVYAENDFGVSIENIYTITMRYNSDDNTYSVLNLEIYEYEL